MIRLAIISKSRKKSLLQKYFNFKRNQKSGATKFYFESLEIFNNQLLQRGYFFFESLVNNCNFKYNYELFLYRVNYYV